MFKLIDYRISYYDNGCNVDSKEIYKIENQNTNEVRWVDEYEYSSIRRKGLLV